MSTMKDPQFLADAEKAKLEITPVSGADIEKLVKEVYGTPKETAAKAAAMIDSASRPWLSPRSTLLASSPHRYGRLAIKSISTRAALASPVTPMHVRAGRLLGGKYDA